MKDQWSGKTLRRFFFIMVARPRRSSAQVATVAPLAGVPVLAATESLLEMVLIAQSAPFPEARADGFLEVALRDQVAVLVDGDRQLRQRAGGRAEHDLAGVGEVERRLVARAEQVVR